MLIIARLLVCSSIGLLATPTFASLAAQDETLPAGMIEVTRQSLLESLLNGLDAAESDGAWVGGDQPMIDARILLGFLGNGDTVRFGEHRECVRRAGTKFLKRFSPELRSPFERGPENDLAHALALNTVVEFWMIDEVKSLESRAKAAAAEAFKRQAENGLWGTGDQQLEATMRMVIGLCALRSDDFKISGKRFAATFASLDEWIDVETGAVKTRDGMDKEDALSQTSAIVAVKLMANVDPSKDEILAKSIEWLTKKLDRPEEAAEWSKKTADPSFWEWTTLACIQVMGRGKTLKRWSTEGARALATDTLKLTREEGLADPEYAATIAGALTAVFRYAPGEFAPGKDD